MPSYIPYVVDKTSKTTFVRVSNNKIVFILGVELYHLTNKLRHWEFPR